MLLHSSNYKASAKLLKRDRTVYSHGVIWSKFWWWNFGKSKTVKTVKVDSQTVLGKVHSKSVNKTTIWHLLFYPCIQFDGGKSNMLKISNISNYTLKLRKCWVVCLKHTCSWNVRASLEFLNVDSITDCIFSMITSWFKRLTYMKTNTLFSITRKKELVNLVFKILTNA